MRCGCGFVQVVPHELLEFSRAVLRSRFSAVVQKTVYTFAFDRFTPATEELVTKLVLARDSASVVIADPTALKSLMLKLVEIMHLLDESREKNHRGGAFKPRSIFRSKKDFTPSTKVLTRQDVKDLQTQAARCVEVLQVHTPSPHVIGSFSVYPITQ